MGEWEVVDQILIPPGPLMLCYSLRFKPSVGKSIKYLKAGGSVLCFNDDDANSVATILNRQQRAATEYCVNLVNEINNEEEG
jgi:hypothetical protein